MSGSENEWEQERGGARTSGSKNEWDRELAGSRTSGSENKRSESKRTRMRVRMSASESEKDTQTHTHRNTHRKTHTHRNSVIDKFPGLGQVSFLVADTRLFTWLCRSVGRSVHPKYF